MSLTGDLTELQIGELLQTITLNNHEGTLKVHSEKEGDRYFYLSKGEIQLVSPGRKGLRLGEALVRANKISQTDLDQALQQHALTGRTLGKSLIELKLIAEAEIEAVVQQQFREEFFELFLMTKGDFEFFFNTRPEKLIQFDETVSRVSVNTSSLMLEALRQIDEWNVMAKAIPTPRAVFTIEDEELLASALEELSPAPAVKQAVELIDGLNPIAEIVEKTPATKFDVYQLLYGLTERKAIRPITHEECMKAAQGSEGEGDTYHATIYYEFGLFLDARDMAMREAQFKLLKRLKVYKEAKEAALVLADDRLEKKDYDGALQYYLEAQACDEKDLRAAEGVFRAQLLMGNRADRAAKAGDDYVKLAARMHDMKRATDALNALIDLEPGVHRRRIQLADIISDEEHERAVELYDEAIKGLTRPEDAAYKADAARKLAALDARRTDAQQTLRDAREQQEALDRRRVRRLILMNVAAVLLVVGAYAATYVIGAGNALAEADAAAANAGEDPKNVLAAIDGYQRVVWKYPSAPAAGKAQDAIGALRERAKQLAVTAEKRRQEELAKQASTQKEQRAETARSLLRQAEADEKHQSYREAADRKLEVVRDYADAMATLDQKVRLAIPIASEPAGATVRVGGREVGKTPTLVFTDPLKDVKVMVDLAGYKPVDLTFHADKFEEAKLKLELTALWTHRTEAAIESAPLVSGGRVYVSSRDGNLYALGAAAGDLAWRLKVGEYGDLVSPPSLSGGKIFIASTEGVVTAINPATGDPVWVFGAEGAVRSEIRSSVDGTLVGVPSATGIASFLKAANGEVVFQVPAEGRVDGAVGFARGRAYFGARDAKLYAVDLEKGAVAWTYTAPDDILCGPAASDDGIVIGSRDGAVIALDAAGKERWKLATAGRIRGAPVRNGASVLVSSEDGKLYAFDAKTGAVQWRFAADAPLVASATIAPKGIYVASTAGTLYRIDAERGAQMWKFSVGSPVLGSVAVADGKVFVGADDGVVRAIIEQ